MGRLPFDLEIEDIAALADIVKEKDLGEIFLKDDDIGAKIVIRGRCCQDGNNPPPPPPMPMPMMMPQMAYEPAATAPAKAETKAEAPAASGTEVKAPVVGTFYASPSPDKPPFVTVGQSVQKGDILMIIESMKIMNEVPSPCSGVVKEILVKSGEAVEYDQTVMIIG